MDRRSFITGLSAALAAPAIVRIDNIMPVRNRLLVPYPFTFSCYLKPTNGQQVAPGLETVPLNNGWYRVSHQMNAFDGEFIPLIVPPDHAVYGVQLEWNERPFKVAKGVTFALKDTNGKAVTLL